jgi:hypothetical protein
MARGLFSLIPEKAIKFAIQDQEDVSLKFIPLYEESPVFSHTADSA